MSAGADAYSTRVFTTPAERVPWRTQGVLRFLEPDRPLRILDLGCGTGEQAFDLARAFPRATVTGVDVSAANVRLGEEKRRALPHGDRVTLIAQDYLELRADPFDAIVSYGALHLVPGSTDALCRKLAADLLPGGLLVSDMPCECLYNTALVSARRVFRALRGRLTDGASLALAKLVHRGVPEELLRERIFYMYVVPERLAGPALRVRLLASGLEPVTEEPLPHASPAQLKHALGVFRRRG